ncbi:MAG: hypothetical protein KDA22_00660 [Phycisphaerales bacterium]|nr:hypothetical protein [Phycisphaerales bacterium]
MIVISQRSDGTGVFRSAGRGVLHLEMHNTHLTRLAVLEAVADGSVASRPTSELP